MVGNHAFRHRGLIAGIVAGAIAVTLLHFQVLQPVEHQLYDQNFHLFWDEQDTSEIIIIGIDPTSLSAIGNFPWPRMFHAEVLRQASRDGAKVIGVDIGFIEPDRDSPRNDIEMVDATREAGNVVFPLLVERRGTGESLRLEWAKSIPELSEAAAGNGHVHIESSTDGIVRQVQLSQQLADERYWSWSIEILRTYFDLPPESLRRVGDDAFGLGDLTIPATTAPESAESGADRILVNYKMNIGWVGGEGSFKHISAYKVINGDFPKGTFTGKIVLVRLQAAAI